MSHLNSDTAFDFILKCQDWDKEGCLKAKLAYNIRCSDLDDLADFLTDWSRRIIEGWERIENLEKENRELEAINMENTKIHIKQMEDFRLNMEDFRLNNEQ